MRKKAVKVLVLGAMVCGFGCTGKESGGESEAPLPDPVVVNTVGCTVVDPELARAACFEQAGDNGAYAADCELLEEGSVLSWFDCGGGSCAQTPVEGIHVGELWCDHGEKCTIEGDACIPGYSCACKTSNVAATGHACYCACASP